MRFMVTINIHARVCFIFFKYDPLEPLKKLTVSGEVPQNHGDNIINIWKQIIFHISYSLIAEIAGIHKLLAKTNGLRLDSDVIDSMGA